MVHFYGTFFDCTFFDGTFFVGFYRDEDEDTAFLDKDNRITKIKGVAGVGR